MKEKIDKNMSVMEVIEVFKNYYDGKIDRVKSLVEGFLHKSDILMN